MFGIGEKEVPEIDVQKAYADIQVGSDVVLVDVRTEEEFSRGNIKGSINVPLQELTQKIESKLPDKNKMIYVYCLSGSRSIVAVDQMIKTGYKKVFNMKSGLLAWRANQLPLQQTS